MNMLSRNASFEVSLYLYYCFTTIFFLFMFYALFVIKIIVKEIIISDLIIR